MSPVLAGLAVAIGVPILLFYVYGVVPVSLCRAGCGVSTSRDGFKFDFDEEGVGASGQSRYNPDASSVDAVSRIGATSIGEVSLSVASGSHMGGGIAHSSGSAAHASSNVSTTAMAGSIAGYLIYTNSFVSWLFFQCLIYFRHRLEVEADISASETASALTCESEKSGANAIDTASTRALAGSILNYRQVCSSNVSEDGVSERVRFDNVCHVIDDLKENAEGWSSNVPHDQEMSADKTSVGSCRSFRSSDRSFREDPDSISLSSLHKRIMQVQQRLPKYNPSQRSSNSAATAAGDTVEPCSASTSRNETDVDNVLVMPNATGTSIQFSPSPTQSPTTSPTPEIESAVTSAKSINGRNVSKLAALRSLFFSQNPDESGGPSGGDAAK